MKQDYYEWIVAREWNDGYRDANLVLDATSAIEAITIMKDNTSPRDAREISEYRTVRWANMAASL